MKGHLISLLLLLLPAPATAAERKFLIANEPFGESDILDARAQPELDGTSSIRITFGEAAAKRVAAITQRLVGKAAHVALDDATLADPVVRAPINDGVLQLSGPWSTSAATALAKRISGKDPLPDSLEE